MRKLAIAMALASTALATPAVARDHSWYAGVEGGVMLVEDANFSSSQTVRTSNLSFDNRIDHKKGYDLDVIGGYDFGMFRGEFEAGYKHAGHQRADAVFAQQVAAIEFLRRNRQPHNMFTQF